jgi:hypothetical protein
MVEESPGQRLRRLLGVRLGRFWQHPPSPIEQFVRGAEAGAGAIAWPSVCCVTPSFNQGAFIAETVRSVLSQGYPRLQYVVQDAGSTDGTAEILASFEPNVLTCMEPDEGQGDALNKGFAKCDADIMGWLNADDILLPGTLHYVAAFFAKNPDIDVVYGDRLVIDDRSAVVGRWILPDHDPQMLRLVDYVPQETMYWRRRAWERIGGAVNAGLQFALDWELLQDFDAAGCTICHLPRLLGGFRVHPAQKTQASIGRGLAEMRTLRAQAIGDPWTRVMLSCRHLLYLARHLRAERRYTRSLRPPR